jgi:C4-dicarboxylate transporter DctM subunit
MVTIVIFVALVGLMMLGVPIAVAMGMTSILTFVALGQASNLPMIAQRMYSATTGFTLLAIPFFILAGNLMNTGGITNRIFRFAKALVGPLAGGLAQVSVVASLIFSGMTGSAVAEAAGLGLIEMRAMGDAGYDRRFAAAVIAASSTIGPVIPPSIPFVIYGSLANVSVGKLFLAGFVPGGLMAIVMMIAVFFTARRRKYPRESRSSVKEVVVSFRDSLLPMGTPVIIIGGILGGIFTPTEAAVIACAYALILGLFVYRELHIRDFARIMWDTALATLRVMFIIAAAGFFGWLLIYQQIANQVIASLTSISSEPVAVLLIIIAILLILGCFIEGIAVLVITIPVFMPIIQKLAIDPVQFGVVMILASMIGLVTPPVGMSLYAVSSISKVGVGPLSKELTPYISGIFLVLMLIAFVPQVSLWIPNLLK